MALIAFIIYHDTRVYDLKTEVESVKSATSKYDFVFDLKDTTIPQPQSDDIYLGIEVQPTSDAVKDVAKSIRGTLSGFQGQMCSEVHKSLDGVSLSQFIDEELPPAFDIPCDELRNELKATIEDPSSLGFPGAEQFSKDVGNVFEAVLKHSCDEKGMIDREKTKDLTVDMYESVCFGIS